MLHKHAIRDRL